MLQRAINSQSISVGEPEPPSPTLRERIDFAISFLRRQYLVILACLLLSLSIGAVYLFITPPSFTASATMMIDTRKSQFLQQSVLGDIPIDSAWIDTQIGILRSEN